jgi:hypothetical protein
VPIDDKLRTIPGREARKTTPAKAMQMPTIDMDELEILEAFEKGSLESLAAEAEIARFKAAARATDIQPRAVEKGVPRQTHNGSGA